MWRVLSLGWTAYIDCLPLKVCEEFGSFDELLTPSCFAIAFIDCLLWNIAFLDCFLWVEMLLERVEKNVLSFEGFCCHDNRSNCLIRLKRVKNMLQTGGKKMQKFMKNLWDVLNYSCEKNFVFDNFCHKYIQLKGKKVPAHFSCLQCSIPMLQTDDETQAQLDNEKEIKNCYLLGLAEWVLQIYCPCLTLSLFQSITFQCW